MTTKWECKEKLDKQPAPPRRTDRQRERHTYAEALCRVKMRMKNMFIHVPFVLVAISTIWQVAVANPGGTAFPEAATTTTAGSSGKNLEGKMFTLSSNSGGVVFFPPYLMPSSHKPSRHRRYYNSFYYTTTPNPSTMPAPPVIGVSVCFRYLTDSQSIQQFFKLGSDSSYSLYMRLQGTDTYIVRFNNQYGDKSYQANKMFWGPSHDLWTSVCLTVDNKKKVAQVFSGSNMSIRKMIGGQLAWSGEPVIEFSSFDGQLTDVQVWDYPISFSQVLSYMYRKYHWPVRGSVITWSSINYSVRGSALLEDSFDVAREKMQQDKLLLAEKRKGVKKVRL